MSPYCRFSPFVKTGTEAFVLGNITVRTQLTAADRVKIVVSHWRVKIVGSHWGVKIVVSHWGVKIVVSHWGVKIVASH